MLLTTALASQLQKIAARSTSTLNSRRLKDAHSASLLFPPAHAATQGFDSIFAIALDGFRELCELDSRFLTFEKTLFGEASKDVDRFMKTKDEVKELNRSIEAFLELVSGKLLFKPAIKATEWLVRRFRVQDQNTTALILAFLPYHSHPTLFPAVLAIIDAKDLSRELQFLRPYLKPALPVSRHVVTHTLSHRRDFLNLLSSHVTSVVKTRRDSHPLLSFFATVAVEAVSFMCDSARSTTKSGLTEEDVLKQVLPLLTDMYAARTAPEFQVGGYMLTTILVSKIPVRDEVLLALMGAIVRGWTQEGISPGMACIALLAQARTGDKIYRLPAEVIAMVLEPEDHVERLLEMGTKYCVESLVVGLCVGILNGTGKTFGEREMKSLIELFECARISAAGRKHIMAALIEVACNLKGFNDKPEEEQKVKDALATSLLKWSEEGDTTKSGRALQIALQASTVDIDALELSLRTVFRRLAIEGSKDDDNVSPTTTKEQRKAGVVTIEKLLMDIPLSLDAVSFLSPEDSDIADKLQRAYSLGVALGGGKNLDQVSQLSLFNDKRELWPLLLAKIWTNMLNPTVTRATALASCSSFVKSTAAEKIDYQALIPLVLVALADPTPKVRSEATQLLSQLKDAYSQLDEGEKKGRKSKGPSLQYWAYEAIYGSGTETENLKWLGSSEAKKFLSSITRYTQEYIMDAAFVGRALAETLGGKSKSNPNKLRSSIRTSILSFLASHAVNVPSILCQHRLLSMLNQVAKAPISRTELLLPVLRKWIAISEVEMKSECERARIDVTDFQAQLVSVIAERENPESVKVLVNAMGEHTGGSGLLWAAAGRTIAIWDSLSVETKVAITNSLMELRLRKGAQQGPEQAMEVLSKVKLPTEALKHIFEVAQAQLHSALQVGASGSGKRRRASQSGLTVIGAKGSVDAIMRATVTAELLESQGAQHHATLLGTLFGILASVVGTEATGITYLQSVLLSCMRDIIKPSKTLSDDLTSTSTIRADVLVSCIRSTSSPQVQNSALLLLSNLADVAPNTVKHSVMPIFTFMGYTTLRQDDEYSAHVIEQTVRRVIPPLVKSIVAEGESLETAVTELINTFVTSYEYVPTHRRLRLFIALTETLGPEEFLSTILLKLAIAYNENDSSTEVKGFARQLAAEFSAESQLLSVVKYQSTIEEVLSTATGKLHALLNSYEGSREITPKAVAKSLLGLLRVVLSSISLKDGVNLLLGSSKDANRIRLIFANALEKTLSLGEKFADDAKLSGYVAQVMDQLLEPLSIVEFLNVVGKLTEQTNSPLCISALSIFRSRVASERASDPKSCEAIMQLAAQVASIVSSHARAEVKAEALLCIQAVSTQYGKQNTNAIFSFAEHVVGAGGLKSRDTGLRVLSLVCLTCMTENMGGRIVPLVPKSIPVTLEYLEASIGRPGQENDMVHDAGFRYLQELVKNVPSFMTTYLPTILSLTAASAACEKYKDTVRENVRKGLVEAVAGKIELKVVISSTNRMWEEECERGYHAVKEAIEMVRKAIANATKATVQKHGQTLLQFWFKSFDLRSTSGLITLEEKTGLEDLAIQVAIDVVYKLNDASFRPMFLRIVDWAIEEAKASDRKLWWGRVATLWKLMRALSENLKALVTDYYSYVLENAVEVLGAICDDEDPTKPAVAWHQVLESLALSFRSDDRDFWQSPNHFDPLVSPLFNQLDNASTLSGTVRELVTPCIVELAAAAQSEEHFKTINSELLRCMRHEGAETRLVAVSTLKEIYARLGEEWLGMLPETVPSIAELLEDDDDLVERETQKLIAKVEEFLGEGELQGMLT